MNRREAVELALLGAEYDSAVTRFWKYVNRGSIDSCWIWIGSLRQTGYGQLSVTGYPLGAHRVSYLIHHGAIATGHVICHTCDTPACVNPGHLFAGTMRDNSRDMAAKGRGVCFQGESNANAKLTAAAIEEARQLRAAGWSLRRIARKFGLHHRTISLALGGQRWRHLSTAPADGPAAP